MLEWPAGSSPWRPPTDLVTNLEPLGPRGTVYGIDNERRPRAISEGLWRGVAMVEPSAPTEAALAYTPDALNTLPVLNTLRDKRNKLWNVASPIGEGALTVKLNRARGIKRVTYLFASSKGKRHWNNATELLRRGVSTPTPVAYAEQARWAGVHDNVYVSEFIPEAFSTRDLFTSFANGAADYRGIAKSDWLEAVGRFVGYMHLRRVVHRDLSSGNILITLEGTKPTFYLIDIGRARFDRGKVEQQRPRWRDLMRICYKLDWPDREALVDAYQANFPVPRPPWWRLALKSYDAKQIAKKRIKRPFKRSRAGQREQVSSS